MEPDVEELIKFIDCVEKGCNVTEPCDNFYVSTQGPLSTDMYGAALVGSRGLSFIKDLSVKLDTGLVSRRDITEDASTACYHDFEFLAEFIDLSFDFKNQEKIFINGEEIESEDWLNYGNSMWDYNLFDSRKECAEFLVWLYIGSYEFNTFLDFFDFEVEMVGSNEDLLDEDEELIDEEDEEDEEGLAISI